MAQSPIALIADDHEGVRSIIAHIAQLSGLAVIEARDGSAALALALSRLNDLTVIVSDIDMPGLSGIELTQAVHAVRPDLPVILITGNRYLARGVTFAGPVQCFEKPVSFTRLHTSLAEHVRRDPTGPDLARPEDETG